MQTSGIPQLFATATRLPGYAPPPTKETQMQFQWRDKVQVVDTGEARVTIPLYA